MVARAVWDREVAGSNPVSPTKIQEVITISKTTTIYVVRHGQSVFNRDRLIAGHSNTPLTEKGKAQALATKDKLVDVEFDVAYSSDLDRAIDTGSLIIGKPIDPNNQHLGLRERNFGDLEGKPESHFDGYQDKIMAMLPEERWHHIEVNGMESDHELATRFIKAIKEIADSKHYKNILIAAHGGSIRTMLIMLNYGTHEDWPPKSFPNAGYVELLYDGNTLSVIRVGS